ncbi:hypothetical protein [Acinetobacter baumannii]|uniref:hypothetical protein n=1 Tax=Acinetobacter baumannii TaxID=470 RepID=UPI0001D31D82|nr:hypothetical protein [Acinetobacter baumannii]EMT96990.1 hypothetical protein ABNIH6_06047 [Acinetobacter baumannii ABNIH6]EMU03012.1 hypothetical protein ABNIH11_08383 [Acinetobacter baumannii ABNIH11]MCA4417157.1 hypothetical protein [Acinetobacter baumannii]MCL8317883.1 hypothetical protein [Acinetobacter baumannii]MDA5004445.1 hypothetical protein [Acinetobacter baumannii]
MRADSCVSVCQPSLVLPPTFDSDRVELLYTQGVRRYAYYFISLIGNLRQNL